MIHTTRSAALAVGLLLVGSVQPVLAAGDANAGRVKAFTCLGCHGVESYYNVYPSYKVPRIGGQHAAYLEAAMQAYRDGQRPHATMRAQAGSLSDQDIADIAAYFAATGNVEEGE